MTSKSAEKKLAAIGRDVTIDRASAWLGSRDAAFRAGMNPAKLWACSVYNPESGFIYEPTTIYCTLAELVEHQTEIVDNNKAAREIYY